MGLFQNWFLLISLFLVVITLYLYFFSEFFAIHAWWILLVGVLVLLFLLGDYAIKVREVNETLKVKNRNEIRINFWN